MRLHKILLETFTLLTVLFLFGLSILGILDFCLPTVLLKVATRQLFFILGIVALFLAIILTYAFISVHKKNSLVVRFSVKPVNVEEAIIQDYLERALKKLRFPIYQLAVEVDQQQKLHVFIEPHESPKIEDLEAIEKKLGGVLGAKLGYQKDFQVYFSLKDSK
jgi:hypothetical protein